MPCNRIKSKSSESTIIFTARCYAESGIATASCSLSDRPSLSDVEVFLSHSLEYFDNFAADLPTVFDGSMSKLGLTSRNLAGTGVGYGKRRRYNSSETEQNRAKVNISIGCLYKLMYGYRLVPECMTMNDL